MRELVCGLVACSVLSQLADGLFLKELGELLAPPAALEQALASERYIKQSKRNDA
jgi:hypothetical protein